MDSIPSRCPDESTLLDFATGALAAVAREAVERHIDVCHPCFEVMAALAAAGEAHTHSGAAGRYALGRVRGAGAMGTVYEAHDPVLDRTVAVKVLRSDLQPTEQRRLRLLREAQSLARIRHPNVVSVYDAGETGQDVYIAMELIDGEPLGDHLRRRPRLPWREIVDLFAQAGAGLAAAHEAGLVHRDFKPTNVLVDARGRVVVTDFGLAASMDVSDDRPWDDPAGSLLSHTLSATAARLGTPAYMAPEQFHGQRATERTDQFAFCVAAVEALTGQRPFAGASVEAWTRSQAEGPDLARLPGPVRLARVLGRGLAFDPAHRYPSMRAILAELRRCQIQRRTRILASVTGTTMSALLAGGWLASQPPPGCVEPLADSWGTERRTAVEARLLDPAPGSEAPERVGTPVGEVHLRSSKQRALAGLDTYATELTRAYGEVCPGLPRDVERGTLEERGQWTCLQSRRAGFDALTARLIEATPAALPSLLGVVGNLETASDCVSPQLALRDLPQPEDAALGARVQGVRLELAVARVKQEADDPAAREAVEALLQESRELGYAPLESEVLGRLARVDLQAFEFEQSARRYAEAYAIAVDSRHESSAASAARGLILALNQLGRFAEARVWAAAAVPLHRSEEERITLSLVRGTVALRDSELDEAQDHFDEAFALRGAVGSTAARSLDATLHTQYGDLLVELEDHQGARRHYERALQLQRERLGSGHVAVADLLVALAETERFDFDFAAARRHLEEAFAVVGELDVGLPSGWVNLGELQTAEGDLVGALASYRRAHETGAQGVFAALVSTSEAACLAQLGRHAEARRACEAGLEGLRAELGPDHPRTLAGQDDCRAMGEGHADVDG